MKRNWTMRVGVTLLALTLITSCFVGGTFAKYTTSGTGTDSARVAKFGVVVSADGNAFSNTYKNGANEVTVTGGGTAKVVAPGTSGHLAGAKITGTPEVAVRIDYATAVTFGENETNVNGKWVNQAGYYYCPIIITVGEEDDEKYAVIKGLECTNIADFKKQIAEAVEGYSENYAAGTDFSKVNPPKISWEWPFEGTAGSGQNDTYDTYLGDQAADGQAAEIKVVLSATVTQID